MIIIKGDVNQNGKIEYEDLVIMQAAILGLLELEGVQFAAADLNNDTEVDIVDLAQMVEMLRGRTIIDEVICE